MAGLASSVVVGVLSVLVAEEELVEARKARHQETDVHLGLLLKQQHGTQFFRRCP